MLTALQYEDTQIKPDPKTLSEAQHTGAEWSEVDKRNVRSYLDSIIPLKQLLALLPFVLFY